MNDRPFWKLSSWLACTVAALGLLTASYSTSFAQEQGSNEAIEEIVVTGSRLRRDDLSAPSPTVIVSEEDIWLSARGTLDGVLNELPQLNSDLSSNTQNIGQAGLHTADLRSLRPERTLVLVNGKRFTPANESGLVDLSRIPDALVERIEVITGGASAVYGSDAIAGAVNFILRDDFEGVELRYNFGQSAESDARTNKIDLIFGTNFADDRGNIMVDVGWFDQEPVFADDRAFSAINVDVRNGELVPSGTSNNPGTSFFHTPTEISTLVGVDLTDFTTDRDFSNGGPGGCSQVQGIRFGRNGIPLPYCDPEDRYNYNVGNYMLRPYERYSVSALADFEINESVQLFTELFWMNNKNAWNLNVSSFRPRTSGTRKLILSDFAINPVMFPAARDFLIANAALYDPDGDGTAEIFGAGRNLTEAPDRFFNYDNTSYSLTGGLRGDLDLGGKDWQWDAYYQYQRATEAQNSTNSVSTLRLSLGLDVIVDPSTGEAICANPFLGCVPVSILGIDAITPEGVAFLTPDKGDQEFFERKVFQTSMNGDLFEMPAGPVAAAFGFEWRDAGYVFKPGGLNERAADGGNLPSIDAGTDVWELFTEVRIPLIADKPAIELLNLELAYRYSDYSNSGGSDTYKAGIEYAPVEWFRFRTAFNRAVRAPNLAELFAPQTRRFEGGDDPCNSVLAPSQAVKDFCVLTGVPADVIDSFIPSVDLSGRRGGNPNLVPEESDTITFGFVISPPFAEGLNVTVDWYDIEVTDAIGTITAETALQTCYALLDINHTTCQGVSRLPNGLVDEVLATTQNIATFQVSGIDLSFDYVMNLPDSWGIGTDGAVLAFRGLATWVGERESQQVALAPVVDCAGILGTGCSGFGNRPVPDFSSKFDVRYSSGNLSIGTGLRTIGEFGFHPDDTRAEVFGGKVEAEHYWDIDARYQITEAIDLTAIVKNITDNKPTLLGQQLGGDSGVDVGLFDVIGQRFAIGFRYVFE